MTMPRALLLSLGLLTAAAPPRTMTIENRSGDVLRGVYLSRSTDDHWGPDRAQQNIRIGASATIILPAGGCRWDVRVILGQRPAEQIFRNRDLCRKPAVMVDGKTNRFLRGREQPRWN
jgi:hypothetical protein